MTGSDIAFLGAPALAFLVATASPGPATLAVAGTAMAAGRRAGLELGLGLALGLALWGVIAGLGFGAAMLAWAPAMTALRVLGGLFLLYLAVQSARAAFAPAHISAVAHGLATAGGRRLLGRGLAPNLMNPKAVLAWTAVIATAAPGDADAAALATIVAFCAAMGLAVYAGYALAFSRPEVMAGYRRARRAIEGVFAALFGAAGIGLLAGQR